jgi:N-acetylmuramoyl-L-alanine amidase
MAAAEPAVIATRYGVHPDRTRFVVELSEPVAFNVFLLADPYRIVVELPEVVWRAPADAGARGAGVIAGFRYGVFQPGAARIVIDLKTPARIKHVFMAPPEADRQHRLVVDIEPTTAETFLNEIRLYHSQPPRSARSSPASSTSPPPSTPAPPSPPPLSAPAPTGLPAQQSPPPQASAPSPPSTPPQTAPAPPAPASPPVQLSPPPQASSPAPRERKSDDRRVVVIDAGHGGIDPGATSVSGVQEKEITLAMALELKRYLERDSRYRVLLTRPDDVFLRLRDRIEIARAAGADLFISLHADSIGTSAIRGASVYTLSEKASDKESEALAAKENKADVIGGVDLSDKSVEVSNILIDLAQRESMNQAARLAGLLIDQLRLVSPVLDRTHRFAGFAVLKAPDIPSVLVELGYLSNRRDEQRLLSEGQRAKTAGAMRRAIDSYFAKQSAQRPP